MTLDRAQLLVTPSSVHETQYSIYVYHYPEDIEDGHSDWQMNASTYDLQDALTRAQTLHDSRSYKKVEIKKKYFDPKFGCVMDTTCKIFQDKRRASRRSSVMALLGLSSFVCFALIAVPFFGHF